MARRTLEGRKDALARLRRSPRIVRHIPVGQRLLDVALVVLSLPVVLPLALGVAVAVFLDSPGPVLYRSRRVGKGGRPFAMLKFRTMVRGAGGSPLSCAGDERYTPLGRRLAASRLDELPQLWNVVRGQMRLVGPRPELEDFVAAYRREYERILSVPPGVTGPAQVEYAWEGDVLARAKEVDRARVYAQAILPYKLAIDRSYVSAHSVSGDIVILLRTVALPVRRLLRGLGLTEPVARGTAVARLTVGFALAGMTCALAGLYVAEATARL
jgi:lipopolysaccharide/colanic/teichoic acid biosynthesis glycosyltransferase